MNFSGLAIYFFLVRKLRTVRRQSMASATISAPVAARSSSSPPKNAASASPDRPRSSLLAWKALTIFFR